MGKFDSVRTPNRSEKACRGGRLIRLLVHAALAQVHGNVVKPLKRREPFCVRIM